MTDMTLTAEFNTAGNGVHRASSHAMNGNILVVVDPAKPRSACIDKAVRLAVKHGCHLELFVCDTEADCPESLRSALSVWDYRRHLRIRRLQMLETLAEPLRLAGVTVHTSATWCSSLAQGIVEFAEHVFADWVIKNRDDTKGAQYLLSETDAALMKRLSASLLLVSSTAWPESPRIDVEFGREGEHWDELLIDRAVSLAERVGGKLDLSSQQRPSVLVMGAPSSSRRSETASPETSTRLRDCDLLLIKTPCQTHPFG